MSYVDVHWLPRLWGALRDDRLAAGLLVALFAAYPFHRLATYWFSLNYSRGDPIVAVLLALWLLGVFGHHVVPKYGHLVVALLGICLFTVGYAHVAGPAYASWWTGVVEVVKLLGAVAWAAAIFAVAYGRSERILPVAVLVSVAIGTWFAWEAVHNTIVLGQGRQTGPFHNSNIFANYLLFNAFVALAIPVSWIGDRWPAVGVTTVAAVPLLVFGLALTASRGAMLGLVVGVAALVVLSKRVRWWMVGVVAIAMVALLQYVERTVENRTEFLLNRYLSEKNLSGRMELWNLALDAFRDHPVLGIGFGQYRELALVELSRNISAHSSLLTIAAETGVVGLAAFLVCFAAVVLGGLELKGDTPQAAFPTAFVVATAGQGLVADVHTFRALWIGVGFVTVYHADRVGSAVDLRTVLLPSRSPGTTEPADAGD